MSDEALLRDELEAAIEVRKETGAELEPEVIDAFVARIGGAARGPGKPGRARAEAQALSPEGDGAGLDGHLDPLFGFAAAFTGLPGVLAVLGALLLIAIISAR